MERTLNLQSAFIRLVDPVMVKNYCWVLKEYANNSPLVNECVIHFLRKVMEGLMPLREEGWMILTKRVTALFFGLALLNEVIWRTMSTESWVWFKTFGLTAAIFVFFLTQGGLFRRYGMEEDKG